MFTTLYNWLVLSSANADKYSLTLKASAGVLVTVLTMVAGLAHINIGSADVSSLIDAIVAFLQGVAFLITATLAVFGLVRKIVFTMQGTHAGLNATVLP